MYTAVYHRMCINVRTRVYVSQINWLSACAGSRAVRASQDWGNGFVKVMGTL